MRQTHIRLVGAVLLGTVLAGCGKPAPTPVPTADDLPVPVPVSGPSDPDPATPVTPVTPAASPLPAEPCLPGATAVKLPSEPYGFGVVLPPSPADASAERPWFGYLSAFQMDEPSSFGGGGILGAVTMRQGGTATVDAAAILLSGLLIPAPTSTWFETHLVFEGIEPSKHQYSVIGDQGNFNFHIPAGQEGDSFRLTIKDVLLDDGTSGDVSVTFCRQTPPKAAVTYRAEDGWRPVSSGTATGSQIPEGAPLTVRVAFSHAMLTDTVERSLTGPHDKTGQGDWLTGLRWLDDQTLEITADRPAPAMQLNLAGAQDQYGLFVAGGVPNLYSGEPPRVLAVDPVSGEETRLAEIPPEPNGATLSPDGDLLRVMTWQLRGGRGVPDAQFLLVDLGTGEAQTINPEDPGWDVPGGIVSIHPDGEGGLTVVRQGSEGPQETAITDLGQIDSFLASPDGKWVAVLTRTGEPAEYPYVPVRFLLVATDDVNHRITLAGEASMYRPGKDGVRLYGPVWSPDSTRLAFTQPTQDGASLVVADMAAGELRTLAASLPGVRSSWDPVTWSPDGSKILVGQLLLDAADGQVLQRIEVIDGMPFWSSDGQRLLFGADGWSEITVYDLRTGKSTSLGKGMALGWRPDGKAVLMRWPNAQYRLMWGY